MTDHQSEDFQALDAAIDAIQSPAVGDGPPKDLVTSTVEALQQLDSPASRHDRGDAQLGRRERMFRYAKYGSFGTAASIAIVLLGSIWLNNLTSQSAFAQVIQNVRDATGATYSLVQKFGNQPAMHCQSAFRGDVIRTEVPGQFVYMANVRTREVLQLIPTQKIAFRGKVDGAAMQQSINLADLMKEMTEDTGELIETITQDGQQLDVYRVSELPSFIGSGTLVEDEDSFRIWVDRETELPTRIEIRMTLGPPGKASPVEMEFTDFDWDPVFPPGMFEMVVPDGYQVSPLPAPN